MKAALRFYRFWLAIGFGLVGLVIYLSLTPSPIDAGQVGDLSFGHLAAYLVLMLWFSQLQRGWAARLSIAAALVLMGVGLEYIQGLTSYRSFDPADMRDNAVGVAMGLALGSTPLGTTLVRIERWMGNA